MNSALRRKSLKDDALAGGWVHERARGPFPSRRRRRRRQRLFARSKHASTLLSWRRSVSQLPLLALAATSTRCQGRPRIVPLSREIIKVIEL